MACRLPAGQTFLQIQYSMSAMSKDFGWVAARCVTLSESSAVISRVKPRSSFTFSATSLRFDTPVPNWRSVTSLMFCDQTVGNPVIAPEPRAKPEVAAAPLSTLRRLNFFGFPVVISFVPCLLRRWWCPRRPATGCCGQAARVWASAVLQLRNTVSPISMGCWKKVLSGSVAVMSPARSELSAIFTVVPRYSTSRTDASRLSGESPA